MERGCRRIRARMMGVGRSGPLGYPGVGTDEWRLGSGWGAACRISLTLVLFSIVQRQGKPLPNESYQAESVLREKGEIE